MIIDLEHLKELRNDWLTEATKVNLNKFIKSFSIYNEESGNPSILFQLTKKPIEIEFRLWSCGTYSVMVVDLVSGQEHISIDKYFKKLEEPKSAFDFILNYIKD